MNLLVQAPMMGVWEIAARVFACTVSLGLGLIVVGVAGAGMYLLFRGWFDA